MVDLFRRTTVVTLEATAFLVRARIGRGRATHLSSCNTFVGGAEILLDNSLCIVPLRVVGSVDLRAHEAVYRFRLFGNLALFIVDQCELCTPKRTM
jgi:hypothetical protein